MVQSLTINTSLGIDVARGEDSRKSGKGLRCWSLFRQETWLCLEMWVQDWRMASFLSSQVQGAGV